jgi:tRNA G10  N-methylase Trm11
MTGGDPATAREGRGSPIRPGKGYMAENSLKQLYDNITRGDEVRQSLIFVRQMIRDESLRRKFMVLLGGDFSVLSGLLGDPDPKTRRNAALILGQTENEDVLAPIMEAWRTEKTLFVREDYLKAVEHLDYRPFLPQLRARLAEIEAGEGQADDHNQDGQEHSLWDNNKHLAGEASQIRRMIEHAGEKKHHTYAKTDPAPELLLVCNRCQVSATAEQIQKGSVRMLKGGVFVKDGSLDELMQVRTWSEMLFPIPGARPVPAQEREAAECLHEMKVYGYLKYLHGGEEGPYRYRIELKGKRALMEKRGSFIRGLTARLDMLEKGKIQNDDTDYEVELRLIERSDGTLAPMLKLFTLKDRRFAYRKASTAQSMSPVNAALVLRLARPYLKENAQVLDPFCGTGTLLIERELILPSGTCYGIDTFGEAIEKARVNTGTIGHINYINRNFFDFTHAYAFDELITELPQEGSRVEEDAGSAPFEERFLRKAAALLAEEAVVVVITRSPRTLEEAVLEARQEGQDYRLLQKYLLNERLGTTEFIFRYRRT